jgi:hypothetical protein
MNRFILALATIAHLVPHPFGVSSVGATALYAGAYGNKKTSWAIPMLPLLIGNAYFSCPGPRLFDGLEIMAHALHPNIHPPVHSLPD